MADWTDLLDPKTWEIVTNAAKASAAILDAWTKIRDRLSRRTPKRNLEQEVDELRTILYNVADLMMKHASNQKEYSDGLVDSITTLARGGVANLAQVTGSINGIVREHEERLSRIERGMRGLLSKAVEERSQSSGGPAEARPRRRPRRRRPKGK